MKIGILTGPTATGKSSLAISLARRHPQIEIVNADSLIVYKGLNIGTAKPSRAELSEIPHHLVDICDPDHTFTAGEFKRAAEVAIQDILHRGKKPLITGGTGFYLKSLLFGLWNAPQADLEIRSELEKNSNAQLHEALNQIDPQAALRIGPSDRYRLIRALELYQLTGQTPTSLESQVPKTPDERFKLWVIDRPTEDLYSQIETRTQEMLKQGLIEEYEEIHRRFPGVRSLQAIGYAQVKNYLNKITPTGRKIRPGIAGLQDEISLATRQLVKQQRTWFRKLLSQIPESKSFLLERDQANLEQELESLYNDF